MARDRYESLQEVFDDAFRGLRAQGFARSARANFDGAGCMYRGPEGRRCAIGHCIPDSVFLPEMEFNTLVSLNRRYPEVNALFSQDIIREDLRQLQSIHDSHAPNMEYRLRNYALLRGLTVPED